MFVLPADSGQLYVYLEPAQTQTGVVPLGGDARYLISADGLSIIEAHRMHNSILEKRPAAPGVKEVAGYRAHVLSDVPEDGDVFYVLRQHPPLPEYVGSAKCTYVVNADGTIANVK